MNLILKKSTQRRLKKLRFRSIFFTFTVGISENIKDMLKNLLQISYLLY